MRGVVIHAGMGLRVTVMYVDSNFMYKRGETEQLQKIERLGFILVTIKPLMNYDIIYEL